MITFAMSIAWIGVLSFVMVDFCSRAGCVLGVPPLLMGLIFIAAGTSVPDALSSVAVGKVVVHTRLDFDNLGKSPTPAHTRKPPPAHTRKPPPRSPLPAPCSPPPGCSRSPTPYTCPTPTPPAFTAPRPKSGMGDMAVANVLGSNVFNIFLGLGLPWCIKALADGG